MRKISKISSRFCLKKGWGAGGKTACRVAPGTRLNLVKIKPLADIYRSSEDKTMLVASRRGRREGTCPREALGGKHARINRGARPNSAPSITIRRRIEKLGPHREKDS